MKEHITTAEISTHPLVKDMGIYYNFSIPSYQIGLYFGHTLDVGMGYALPYYTDSQFLAFGVDVNLYAQSLTYVKLRLPFANFTLRLDLEGMKVALQPRGFYDTVAFTDLCYSLYLKS